MTPCDSIILRGGGEFLISYTGTMPLWLEIVIGLDLKFPGAVTISHSMAGSSSNVNNVKSVSAHRPPKLLPVNFKKSLVDAGTTA